MENVCRRYLLDMVHFSPVYALNVVQIFKPYLFTFVAGLVCTGSIDYGVIGWDPRATASPVFTMQLPNGTWNDYLGDIISCESLEGGAGSHQLLIGETLMLCRV
jgi:hypothetical protein